MISKWLYPAIAAMTILGIGIAHGMMMDRWGVSGDVKAAAQRLEDVPASFGDWTSEPSKALSARAKLKAGAIGYLSRNFRNEKTGAVVSVMILCGRPGPIASHDPSVCFTQAGMHQLATEEKRTLKLGEDKQVEFLAATFRPPVTSPGPDLEAYWALSPDGRTWSAISDGRVKFAREPMLFRTYMTSSLTDVESRLNVVQNFLKDFLPVLSSTLVKSDAPRK